MTEDEASPESEVRRVLTTWASKPGRAVIFDFNGTLSDDEPVLLEIFAEIFLERLGRRLSAQEYYDRLAGLSDREIVATIVEETSDGDDVLVEELLRMRTERYRTRVAGASPVTSLTAELVDRLAAAAVPVGIVTGAQRSDVQHVLAGSPVGQHITAVVTEEDVTRGKPDPEGFLRGAELLGHRPDDILVFEDSAPGVLAARSAGMACIAVTGPRPSSSLGELAPARVPALTPELLDSLPGFG